MSVKGTRPGVAARLTNEVASADTGRLGPVDSLSGPSWDSTSAAGTGGGWSPRGTAGKSRNVTARRGGNLVAAHPFLGFLGHVFVVWGLVGPKAQGPVSLLESRGVFAQMREESLGRAPHLPELLVHAMLCPQGLGGAQKVGSRRKGRTAWKEWWGSVRGRHLASCGGKIDRRGRLVGRGHGVSWGLPPRPAVGLKVGGR